MEQPLSRRGFKGGFKFAFERWQATQSDLGKIFQCQVIQKIVLHHLLDRWPFMQLDIVGYAEHILISWIAHDIEQQLTELQFEDTF